MGPRFCISHKLPGNAAALNHTARSQVRSKALCCQGGYEGPEERTLPCHPQTHSFPTPACCEWVTDEANMLIPEVLGRVEPPELPHCAKCIIIFFCVLWGGRIWEAQQSSQIPHQLCEVWTLKWGRGDEGAAGGGGS